MPKKQKTIKAWAIVDKKTGEICHYWGKEKVEFFRIKKAGEKEIRYWGGRKYYKIIPVEIKILK